MRRIGTLPEEPARRLTDFLATLKIDSQLLAESGGMGVWICDEDRVSQAKEELQQFLREPSAKRYIRASSSARALRRREEIEEEEYRQIQEAAKELAEDREEEARPGPRPLTFIIMAICVLVAFASKMGNLSNPLTRSLLISVASSGGGVGLHEVLSGEVWRLVTPIFLHFEIPKDPTGIMHLLFNLLMFLPLAGQIESHRGTGRLLILILVFAVVSNLAQYYLGGSTVVGFRPVIQPGSYAFGGMSGVVYGLFGYIWLKSRLEPELGLSMSTSTVILLLGWLFLGPVIDKNIANGAHFGGLIAGMLVGAIPGLWRRPAEDEEDNEDE
jgi:GlpG protein